jgi:thiamine biosynthesis lipoprotein
VLKLGLKIFDRTGGLMNLMVGDRLIAQGYDDRYSFTPNGKITNIPNPHEVLLISESNITLKEGSIDMGGYGKGLLIDLISKRLLQHHFIPYFLINGGGDIFATSDEGEPITIYLEHPTKTDTYLTTTTIRNQGFAASSPHKRAWKHNGSLYSHIINPRPQTDQSNIDATFIKAPAACTADIFATTAIICSASELEGFSKKENLAVALYSLEKNSLTKNALF